MSAPTWLPPLNSHEDYVTLTKIEEAEDILDHITPKPEVPEDMFYIHIMVSVMFFNEIAKIGFPGLLLEEIFPAPCSAVVGDSPCGCTEFGEITKTIVTQMNIPFQMYPIRYLETDNEYSLHDENSLIQRILPALSTMRSKRSNSNIVPVRWHIFKHVFISDNENYAWRSWYTQKTWADPNFEHQYMAAINRPRTTEESLYEELVKFKAATASSIEALEVIKVQNFESTSSCSVCLEDFCGGSEAIRLPCSHVFHRECIIKWLQESHMCPLCRFTLPTSVEP